MKAVLCGVLKKLITYVEDEERRNSSHTGSPEIQIPGKQAETEGIRLVYVSISSKLLLPQFTFSAETVQMVNI